MEKLIELLNEAQNSGVGLFGHWVGNFERKYYAKNHWRLTIETLGYTDEDYEIYDYSNRDICGKDGGLIKWLVENDKIDLEKVKTLKSGHKAELFDYIDWLDGTMEVINYHYFEDYEQLLMLLSISDTPIEDLISYLK